MFRLVALCGVIGVSVALVIYLVLGNSGSNGLQASQIEEQSLAAAVTSATNIETSSRHSDETAESNVDNFNEADALLERALKPWKGDLDGMVERRLIRALVAFSKTFYFLDRAQARGLSYETLRNFEAHLNKKLKTKTLTVDVVFIPVSRDKLIPYLNEGRGDLAVANLTITPERLEKVDFSDPFLTNVSEVPVTGPESPEIKTLDDLAGKEIFVRGSSSYYHSLVALNKEFKEKNLPQMELILADEHLEDEDLLEMVNAGLYPMIVMDLHKAAFWEQVFDDITVHRDIAVRTGGNIAWAMRKNSPKLRKMVDSFASKAKAGTELGNILFKRYLKETDYVKNAASIAEQRKFLEVIELFKKYGNQYNFDYLMLAAMAYQESRLEQSAKSHAGAVGVMQIKPNIAAADPIKIDNINDLENNVHAGVKYLRHISDTYFTHNAIDPYNRQLFSFAAYNAGPTRISKLRPQAAKQGLNPNQWFQNVELVAAKKIGREPVQYVGNILKYYVAYRRIIEHRENKRDAKRQMKNR